MELPVEKAEHTIRVAEKKKTNGYKYTVAALLSDFFFHLKKKRKTTTTTTTTSTICKEISLPKPQ